MSRLDDVTISRQAWGAKPPTNTDTNFTKAGGIVVHHTGVHSGRIVKHWPDCYEAARGHQRYHQVTQGWWDLAYNWLICKHGFAFEGRGWANQNGANTPVNSSTLSICWEGHGSQELPIEPAVETFRNLIVEAVNRGWEPQVRAHSEVSTSGSTCPGHNFRSAILPQLKGYVANLGIVDPPAPPPTPPPAATFDQVVVMGPPTTDVGQMQRWAKTNNGTTLFVGLAPIAFEVSVHLGVDPAVTYAIMGHETAFGRFGGVLDESFHNWGGIKTLDGGDDHQPDAHHRFLSHRTGIIAVAQHAGRYAGLELAEEYIIDPRWSVVNAGAAPTLPDDDWVWAYDTHDDRVVAHIRKLRQT